MSTADSFELEPTWPKGLPKAQAGNGFPNTDLKDRQTGSSKLRPETSSQTQSWGRSVAIATDGPKQAFKGSDWEFIPNMDLEGQRAEYLKVEERNCFDRLRARTVDS